jgi:hypothetical protein
MMMMMMMMTSKQLPGQKPHQELHPVSAANWDDPSRQRDSSLNGHRQNWQLRGHLNAGEGS